MTSSKIIFLFVLMGLLIIPPDQAQAREYCSYQQGRKIENLSIALNAHKHWIKREGWKDPEISGRAIFCNADMSGVDLNGANLQRAFLVRVNFSGADLSGANLEGANLEGANLRNTILSGAKLEGAIFWQAKNLPKWVNAGMNRGEVYLQKHLVAEIRKGFKQLNGADLQRADLSGADLIEANLKEANLEEAILDEVNLRGANLRGAILGWSTLVGANLDGAYMKGADLEGAELAAASLKGSYLLWANLEGANLSGANLEKAFLDRSNLEGANLFGANLEGANLVNANLKKAALVEVNLKGAKLSGVDLAGAQYQPATGVSQEFLSGLVGIRSIRFCPGEYAGLAKLRTAFKSAGLGGLERDATYALEFTRTRNALENWNSVGNPSCALIERDFITAVEGIFRLVFLEWTTGYGLFYARPILIFLGLIGIFTPVYLYPIMTVPKRSGHRGGIYRILPEGRVRSKGKRFNTANEQSVVRLYNRGIDAIWKAFHISVVSALCMVWRDLNVGTWITRMKPREYALRARGWVRVVSGVQSLFSVCLFAICVLTYFG
jgi:uncharacterized protein YjbI with pentapeptide repeats